MTTLQWLPEGPGFYAEANGWTFCMSYGPTQVTMSRHNGDGNWIHCGIYPSNKHAAAEADAILAANA